MTITEFLEARIAEDEAAANVAAEWVAGGPEPHVSWYGEMGDKSVNAFGKAGQHVAAMSPARVLAECAAKRAIIAQWGPHETLDGPNLLTVMATVYSAHPDYRQEWSVA